MQTCPACQRKFEKPSGWVPDECPECAASAPEIDPPKDERAEWLNTKIPARVTQALLAVNAVVFAAMVATGVSAVDPNGEELLRWGADYGPLTLGGQWWRAFTSNYLHFGFVHLLLNMWCLWDLGNMAERIYGRWPFAAAYTLCGLAGSAASLLWIPQSISAGASGAVFGVAGLLLAAFYLKKLQAPQHLIQKNLKSVGMFVLYNVLYGAAAAGINNAAHLGGLVMGFVLGALLPDRRPQRAAGMYAVEMHVRSSERPALPVFVLGAFAVIAGLYSARYVHGHAVQLYEAGILLQAGRADGAIKIAESVVASKPEFVEAHVFLARAYADAKQYDAAYASAKKAIALHQENTYAWFSLGVAAIHLHRDEEAAKIFERVAKAWPDSWGASHNLSIAYANLGRYTDAIAVVRRAVHQAPQEPSVHATLANFYLHENQPDAALAAAGKAIALDPKHIDAYIIMARAYEAKNMEKEAAAAYEKAEALTAKDCKQ